MDTSPKQNSPTSAAVKIRRSILLLAAIIVCSLFQSCATSPQNSHLAINSTPDDRSFSGDAKRFERPPPFGSRFNND